MSAGQAIARLTERYNLVAARVAGEDVEASWPSSDVDIGVLPVSGCDLSPQEKVALMQAL